MELFFSGKPLYEVACVDPKPTEPTSEQIIELEKLQILNNQDYNEYVVRTNWVFVTLFLLIQRNNPAQVQCILFRPWRASGLWMKKPRDKPIQGIVIFWIMCWTVCGTWLSHPLSALLLFCFLISPSEHACWEKPYLEKPPVSPGSAAVGVNASL